MLGFFMDPENDLMLDQFLKENDLDQRRVILCSANEPGSNLAL